MRIDGADYRDPASDEGSYNRIAAHPSEQDNYVPIVEGFVGQDKSTISIILSN